MRHDVTHGIGNYETVAPKILEEKNNFLAELNEILDEEDDLQYQLKDIQSRLQRLQDRKKEVQIKLNHNDKLSLFWVLNRPTTIAAALEAEKIKMEKREEIMDKKQEEDEKSKSILDANIKNLANKEIFCK